MNNFKKRNLFFIRTFLFSSITCIVFLLTGCNSNKNLKPISMTEFKLNTIVTITLYNQTDNTLLTQAMALCDELEQLLSATNPDSEIYQLNHNLLSSKNNEYKLSTHTSNLISTSLYYSNLTDGYFDITLGPLTSLWDFTCDSPKVPSKSSIEKKLPHIGYQDISINNQYFTFNNNDMALDLGGIAKGYIADELKNFLVSKGVTSGMINLGGNVVCIGSKPDGSPFTIGIQKPFSSQNDSITTVKISDQSVVSAGNYQRYFEEDGILYHHILNPKTGYPYDTDLLSVTIISPTSVEGDALSTACFGLGLAKGMNLLESLPNVQGIFVTLDYKIHYTNPSSNQ